MAILLVVVMAAPFFALPSIGGFLSLLIIFWGLQRAWMISGQAVTLHAIWRKALQTIWRNCRAARRGETHRG